MTKYFYKLLPDLPAVPDDLVSEAYQLLETRPRDRQKNTTLPEHQPQYKQRILDINGQKFRSATSKRYHLSDRFREWVRENIAKEFNECSVSITDAVVDGQPTPVHGAHTDYTRHLVLIYPLETGGDTCDTVFYREIGQDIYRYNDLGCYVSDYSQLEQVDSVRIPKHTWCLIDTAVLHGVNNIDQDRIAIQVGLDQDDSVVRSGEISSSIAV